MVTLMSLD